MLLFMCREYFIKPFVPLNLPRPVTSIFIDAPVAWRCAEARELPGSPLCAAGSCSLVIDTLKSGCWDLTPAPEVRRRCLRRGHVFQNTPPPMWSSLRKPQTLWLVTRLSQTQLTAL